MQNKIDKDYELEIKYYDLMKDIKEVIHEELELREISKTDFSLSISNNRGYLSHMFCYDQKISLFKLLKVCEALDLEITIKPK